MRHWGKIIVILMLWYSAGVAAVTEGDFINFAWDANIESDLAGYRIYVSNQSGVYVYGDQSPNLIHEVACNGGDTSDQCTKYSTDQMGVGVWYFVITAYDLAGQESEPSENELTETIVTHNPPPAFPVNWRFDVTP